MTAPRTQQERTRATRTALTTAGRTLFAQRGYAAVPAEEIVAAAGVTRGALQHHFGDKKELFRAIFEQMESELPSRVSAAVTGQPDSWAAMTAGLKAFLDACQEPEILQIALTDAPAVLGWAEWRAIETRYGLGLIQAALEQAMTEGVITRQPVDVLAHLVLSAVIEAALVIAHASDRDAARVRAEQALRALLDGLRR